MQSPSLDKKGFVEKLMDIFRKRKVTIALLCLLICGWLYVQSQKNRSRDRSKSKKGDKEKKQIKARGLKDLGGMCYLNSVLQCLVHTEVMKDITLHRERKFQNWKSAKHEGLYFAWVEFMQEYWAKDDTDETPAMTAEKIEKALRKYETNKESSGVEQDGFECVVSILNGVHDDINQVSTQQSVKRVGNASDNDESIANRTWKIYEQYRYCSPFTSNQTLEGLLRIEHFCTHCHQRIYQQFEEFLSLKLPISLPIANPTPRQATIEECLAEYEKIKTSQTNVKYIPRILFFFFFFFFLQKT
ncbi:ubiquitin carboxyl-terminal hydrolase [Reticulomyxa filosa]|uniref:Ubiquitin carboxyl-terminal hydrolase n=1 Tax=Reticulomyxa filosa TaxID=46433 RepID=X6MQI9_RETFI|nr:ubiquitin carboxyl-terminal hydrolase [Reticulomyxa filosa]|eukprot:ETO16273.1 ubiquitin carboxyl-terminal hydrolase [Reticulomyxa filosa]